MSADALIGTDNAMSVLIKAIVFYGYMVFLLRISGKRTTMTMTSFDFVSTVAMATIVGSTILSGTVSLFEGIIAVTGLVVMQWLFGLLSARSDSFRHLVTSEPTLLYKDGQFQERNLKTERISRAQLLQKARVAGFDNTDNVTAMVLESAGTVSVIEKSKATGDLKLEA